MSSTAAAAADATPVAQKGAISHANAGEKEEEEIPGVEEERDTRGLGTAKGDTEEKEEENEKEEEEEVEEACVVEEGERQAGGGGRSNYESRKPKWWRSLKGRRPTKAQRACLRRMSEAGYVIDVPKHGGGGGRRPGEDGGGDCGSAGIEGRPPTETEKTTTSTPDWEDGIWRRPRRILSRGGGGEGPRSRPTEDEKNDRCGEVSGVEEAGDAVPSKDDDEDDDDVIDPPPETWLEIGFGDGENLQELARRFASEEGGRRRFVGAEVFPGGAGNVLRRVERAIMSAEEEDNEEGEWRRWRAERYYAEEAEGRDEGEEGDEVKHGDENGIGGQDGVAEVGGEARSGLMIPPPSARAIPPPVPVPSLLPGSLPYDNLRIYPGDGTKLLRSTPSQGCIVPPDSLSAILVTFPDPFPKDAHRKWRILQDDTLLLMERALIPGRGRLFVATDSDAFAEWAEEVVRRRNDTAAACGAGDSAGATSAAVWERVRPVPDRSEWLPVVSRYEAKGWEEGRTTKLRCWRLLR